MALRPEHKLTYVDYAAFPDDGLRHELIDGEAFVTPAPSIRHQDVLLNLAFELKAHVRDHGGGRVIVAPCDVLLSEFDVVQPDIVFVASSRQAIVGEANIKGAPSLLVEVVSDQPTDRVRKRDLYARSGVGEYWIVDPESDRVDVLRLHGNAYADPITLEPSQTLETELLPGLAIDLAQLFAR